MRARSAWPCAACGCCRAEPPRCKTPFRRPRYNSTAMNLGPASLLRRWFDSERGAADRLIPRWIFLRALGLIYFSAFFSLVFQIRGLIGTQGILPCNEYLEAVAHQFGAARFWFAPTLLWFSTGPHMLGAICWVGMIAALLVVCNVWPRATLFLCLVCFLSFVSAAQDFSGYQSDGMLLEAGFISLFFAPPGFLPGLGRAHPQSRGSMILLQWGWLRWPAAMPNGAISPPWTSTTKTARCPPGLVGMCSTFRTGSTPSPPVLRWGSNSAWCSCCSCRGAGGSRASSSLLPGRFP